MPEWMHLVRKPRDVQAIKEDVAPTLLALDEVTSRTVYCRILRPEAGGVLGRDLWQEVKEFLENALEAFGSGRPGRP